MKVKAEIMHTGINKNGRSYDMSAIKIADPKEYMHPRTINILEERCKQVVEDGFDPEVEARLDREDAIEAARHNREINMKEDI